MLSKTAALFFITAIVFSLAMHVLALTMLFRAQEQWTGQQVLHLELYRGLHVQAAALDGQQHKGQTGDPAVRLARQAASPFGDSAGLEIQSEKNDPELQAVLRKIKQRIALAWQGARPPETGLVEIRLKIGAQGELLSLWVLRLDGSPVLTEFVSDLVLRAAPFPEIMQLAGNGLLLDCAFSIQEGPEKQ